MTKNSLDATLAALADSEATRHRCGHAAPPGTHMRSGSLSPIILTDAAATQAGPDLELAALLPNLSTALHSEQARASLIECLGTKFGAEKASQAKFILTGKHELGSGIYVVGGDAIVTANGDGVVLATEHACIVARGHFDVYACDHADIKCFDDAQIYAIGDVTIRSATGRVRGYASGNVQGDVLDGSSWTLSGNARFDVRGAVSVEADGNVVLRMYNSSRLNAKGSVRAIMYERAMGWLKGNAKAELWGETLAYAERLENVKVLGGEARKALLTGGKTSFAIRAWRSRSH
jgi:hypothetical protein